MYLDCIFAAAIRLPEEPLAARLAGPAEDLNLVGDHKCWVEANTKLTNDVFSFNLKLKRLEV